MPLISLAKRPVIRPSGLVVQVSLVLLLALAGLPMVSRLWVPPTVRTTAVGRAPTALVVDARTQHVFVVNLGSNTVSMLNAARGTLVATIAVAPHPITLAVATTAGRVFAVSDRVTPDGAGRVFVTNAGDDSVSVLDARSGRVLRTISVGQSPLAVAVVESLQHVFVA